MTGPAHRGRADREAGETLLEVLIASALMAIAVVAILGGLGTTVLSTVVHRDQADANTVLVKAVETMKGVPFNQVDCSAAHTDAGRQATYVNAATPGLPSGWTVSVSIKYQTGTSGSFADSTCTKDFPLQLVTVTATSPSNRATPKMNFVKGDV